MKTMTLDADLLQNFTYIAQDEDLMKKLSRYMRRLLKTKEDETLMTEEDFFARVDEAKKAPSMRFASVGELDNFIRNL